MANANFDMFLDFDLEDGAVSVIAPHLMALKVVTGCEPCRLLADEQCSNHPCTDHIWVTKLEYVTAKLMGPKEWAEAREAELDKE